jgi:hypothetical protein
VADVGSDALTVACAITVVRHGVVVRNLQGELELVSMLRRPLDRVLVLVLRAPVTRIRR